MAAPKRASETAPPARIAVETLLTVRDDLTDDATDDRVLDTAKALALAWAPDPTDGPVDTAAEAAAVCRAVLLSIDLALARPLLRGETAFERLARRLKRPTRVQTAALLALRRGRYRLCRVEAIASNAMVLLRDLATGECLEVLDAGFSAAAVDCEIFARIGPTDGGWLIVGVITPLDAAARAVVDGFIGPDRSGLTNPLRCAEVLYRHVVHHGTRLVEGLNAPQRDAERDAEADAPNGGTAKDDAALLLALSETLEYLAQPPASRSRRRPR